MFRGRLLVLCTVSLGAGLLGTLAYLPVRAHALFAAAAPGAGLFPPAPDVLAWGDGRTPGGLLWILSARTFVGKTAVVQQNAEPWTAPFVLFDELHALAPLALFGLALGLLRRPGRRLVGLLAAAGGGALLAALRGGMDPQNPDIRGYLGLTMAAGAGLGALALALLLAELRRPRLQRAVAGAALLASLVVGLARLPRGSLAGARAADLGGDQLLDSLPRAVALTSHFETGFLLSYQRAVEGRRPDVDWVHLGFVRGPGYAERLARARPTLAPLLNTHLRGPLLPEHLFALQRPALLEPDDHLHPRLRAVLAPAGILWLATNRPSPTDSLGELPEPPLWPFPPRAFAEAARDRQVRGFFAFRAYGDATLACARGLPLAARLRVGELRRLLPEDARTKALVADCPAAAPAPLY